MQELLTRSASVNQLAIYIAAEVFNIAIGVWFPCIHNRTSLADSRRKSVTYNDSGEFSKKVEIIWCSTFGPTEELPLNWNPHKKMNFASQYINHFEPLVERENDDKESRK